MHTSLAQAQVVQRTLRELYINEAAALSCAIDGCGGGCLRLRAPTASAPAENIASTTASSTVYCTAINSASAISILFGSAIANHYHGVASAIATIAAAAITAIAAYAVSCS